MEEMKMLGKKKWAVVGATNNKEKYGYKIYKKLKNKGYEVYAVNPNYEEVDGDKCYPNLKSLPVVPDAVDIVVAPKFGINSVKEAYQLGINNIWLQPGTVSDEILEYSKDKNLNTVQACVMVALNYV